MRFKKEKRNEEVKRNEEGEHNISLYIFLVTIELLYLFVILL